MSIGDLIVAAIIIGLVLMAIFILLRGRRKGTSACGCNCGSCCSPCGSVITDKTISENKEEE